MPHNPDQGPKTGCTPHITIRDKRAKEAVAFYQRAFGAEVKTTAPAQDGERLMHAHLIVNGGSLILNDDFPEFHQGSYNVTPGGFVLHLQVEDADAAFQRALDAGATVRHPLQDQFWGDRYGHVVDPFGIIWSIGATIA